MKVSLIATVLNEADTVGVWLESFLHQTRQPDEIVIVDGGSTDGTPDVIRRFANKLPINLIACAGVNISQGRNIAIREAQYPVIASTDAGVRLHRDWLTELIKPFEDDPEPNSVAGFFLPDYDHASPFEIAMSATILPTLDDIDSATFLPSSRSVAFRKDAWAVVGGYPEWLDYSEDLIFDIRLKALTGDFTFAPDAIAYFKPRTSLASYFVQYFRYARGDGKADLWRKRHVARYLTYLVAIPLIAVLGVLVYPALWLLYLLGAYIYLRRPIERLTDYWQQLALLQKLGALLLLVVIRIVGDIAKMIGYPVGLWWRNQHQPPDWRPDDRSL
ncbi:MAG: glycosyltransferase [Chloroflexi bacterium]|nr:glycosyltransferase [Chloroflexota bacterium]